MMRRFVLFGLSLHRLSVQRIMVQGLLTAGLCLLQVPGVVMAQEPPKVVAVDYPLAYFAERLGGNEIEVLFDVPAGLDPEFWRPDIATLTEIQAADLVALNGASTAAWTTKVSLSRSRLVDTSASFAGDYITSKGISHNHGEDGEHTHTGTASYTWLDFDQAAAQAQALVEAIKKRLPEVTGVDENIGALNAELEVLAGLARKAGAQLRPYNIITTHPRYQYFARAYGLNIDSANSLEWAAGEMPTDDQWADLEQRVEGTDVSIIIWEAEPPEGAFARASEIGLTSVVFPPLANRPAEGNFLSEMSAALQRLISARP